MFCNKIFFRITAVTAASPSTAFSALSPDALRLAFLPNRSGGEVADTRGFNSDTQPLGSDNVYSAM
jgi:hypothetical protein